MQNPRHITTREARAQTRAAGSAWPWVVRTSRRNVLEAGSHHRPTTFQIAGRPTLTPCGKPRLKSTHIFSLNFCRKFEAFCCKKYPAGSEPNVPDLFTSKCFYDLLGVLLQPGGRGGGRVNVAGRRRLGCVTPTAVLGKRLLKQPRPPGVHSRRLSNS